jgi:hypothetical protein
MVRYRVGSYIRAELAGWIESAASVLACPDMTQSGLLGAASAVTHAAALSVRICSDSSRPRRCSPRTLSSQNTTFRQLTAFAIEQKNSRLDAAIQILLQSRTNAINGVHQHTS